MQLVHRSSPHRSAGFTLVELLVVIAIMALLAALTLGAFSYSQRAAARSKTTTTLAAIASGLERYQADFGEYPGVSSPGNTIEVNNRQYDAGGAATLYQALSGDGYDQIYFAQPPAGDLNPASDGQLTGDEGANRKMADMPTSVFRILNGLYFMIDGFSQPFQYMPRGDVSRGGFPDTVNPTFDLWSYSEDEFNTTDITRDTKLNRPEVTDLWIKNW